MTKALPLLPPDYRDMLIELDRAGVEYVVIGGWAMAVHGHARATKDIDVFVRATPANAQRVLRALAAFGAPMRDVSEADFASPGTIFQIGVKLRIDVTTTIDGVSFEEAMAGHVVAVDAGLRVPFIGRDALIKNKLASARPQDLIDVETLQRA